MLLKQVLRYIKGTSSYNLVFKKSNNGLQLMGYSDADWASSVDRRSTTGYCFSLTDSGPAVSWKSRKQPTVALSSCESEFMALAATAQEAVYLNQLLIDLTQKSHEPVFIQGDNQGAIAMVRNPIKHDRSKHIDVKYNFVRDYVMKNKINISYISTDKNIADIMTKPCPKMKFENFGKYLFGIKSRSFAT